MPKLPRLTALEAERRLLAAGFVLMRSKGSHRIYFRGGERVVPVPQRKDPASENRARGLIGNRRDLNGQIRKNLNTSASARAWSVLPDS